MMRSSYPLVAAVFVAALTSGCQTVPTDEYARATAPVKQYITGSRVPRAVDPKTGKAVTSDRVYSFRAGSLQSGSHLVEDLYTLPWIFSGH